jgi:hypothetical protein
MRVPVATDNAENYVLDIGNRGPHGMPLLGRWDASEGKFVIAELDWDDQLDAALGKRLLRFKPENGPYDA